MKKIHFLTFYETNKMVLPIEILYKLRICMSSEKAVKDESLLGALIANIIVLLSKCVPGSNNSLHFLSRNCIQPEQDNEGGVIIRLPNRFYL